MIHSRRTEPCTVCSETDADWIERQVMQACVQLALETDDEHGAFSVPLARFGSLELCLTEMPQLGMAGLPSFWVELRMGCGAVIDSFGFYEFDEDELVAISDFICDVMRRWRTLH